MTETSCLWGILLYVMHSRLGPTVCCRKGDLLLLIQAPNRGWKSQFGLDEALCAGIVFLMVPQAFSGLTAFYYKWHKAVPQLAADNTHCLLQDRGSVQNDVWYVQKYYSTPK